MTIGANSNRDELVRTLRGMQFSKLNLGFLKGEDLNGKQREGYDKYGKYQIRFGWGIGAILAGLAAYAMFYAFFPRRAYYYDDPDAVWIRENVYWLIPIWAVPAYFLWKANRKVENEESSFLSKAVAKNGLVVLPSGTHFPGDLGSTPAFNLTPDYVSVGTVFDSAFALKYEDQIKVAFGLSSLWWDASSSGLTTNRGLNPTQSLFVWVSVPELSGECIYLNPSKSPNWSELPAMNGKARETLAKLSSRYAVVIGDGGIGVGLAKDSTNGMQTSLRADMKSPYGWSACYGLLSEEVADIIEGLE